MLDLKEQTISIFDKFLLIKPKLREGRGGERKEIEQHKKMGIWERYRGGEEGDHWVDVVWGSCLNRACKILHNTVVFELWCRKH